MNTMVRAGNSTVEAAKTETGYRLTVRDYNGVVLSSTLFTAIEWDRLLGGMSRARWKAS